MIIAIISLLILVSCGKKYHVKFVDHDGTLLYETTVRKGELVEYKGELPKKAADKYLYDFCCWDYPIDYPIYEDKVITALYSKQISDIVVTFCDYDGTFLYSTSVQYGQELNDFPANPSRKGEKRANYYFSGWGDVDFSYITKNIICYAQYEKKECYEIQYRDDDGSLLNVEYIEEGRNSEYIINTIKESNENEYLVFSNWSEPVTNVTCDMVVFAEYNKVEACIVTFENYDGTILGTDKGPKGFDAEYSGPTPKRMTEVSGDYTYTYSFSGWNISLDDITSNVTAKAQFTSRSKYYNAKYEAALETIRVHADNFNSETGKYHILIDTTTTSSGLGLGYAEYDSSDNVVDLSYCLMTADGYCSIEIFFDLHKPGSYSVYYKYVVGDYTTAHGTLNISGSWNSYSNASFKYFSNYGSLSKDSHATLASSLISTCLYKASTIYWIDLNALGFSNY